MEVCPYSYFWWCGYFRGPSVICHDTWVLSEGHKNYLKDWCLMNSQPTFLVLTSFELNKMAILSKGCKPDNFESHNSLNLCLTNTPGLSSNFVKCEFFLGSKSPSWHFCSIWNKLLFWQFLCKESSFFNSKVFCYSHAWFWSLHEERTSFCMDLSLENSADPCLCFQLALLHSASCFFFLYSKGDVPFHCIACDYSCADWGGLCDHLIEMFHGKISLN